MKEKKKQYRVNWKPKQPEHQSYTIEQSQKAALKVVSELVRDGFLPVTLTIEAHNGRTDGF